jgi:ankyrin repeat protein
MTVVLIKYFKSLVLLFIYLAFLNLSSAQSIFESIIADDTNQINTIIKNPVFKDIPDTNGDVSLSFAVKNMKINSAKFLIKNNISINTQNTIDGSYVLHWVRDTGLAKMLVENGAEIDAKDNKGNTPLHVLVEESKKKKSKKDIALYKSLIKILLLKTPDVYLKNDEEKTPADLASPEIKKLLLNYEKNQEYKLDLKLKELRQLSEKLEKKSLKIKDALKTFTGEISDLENEIKNEKKQKRIVTYEKARENKLIYSNLTLIQQKRLYIETLKREDSITNNRMIEVTYYTKKTQDEQKLYKTLGNKEATDLFSQLNQVIYENSPRSEEIVTDVNNINYNESLEDIYNRIR